MDSSNHRSLSTARSEIRNFRDEHLIGRNDQAVTKSRIVKGKKRNRDHEWSMDEEGGRKHILSECYVRDRKLRKTKIDDRMSIATRVRFQFCYDCKLPLCTLADQIEHFQCEDHKRVLKLIEEGYSPTIWSPISVDANGIMECEPCQFFYRKLSSWKYHLSTQKHKMNVAIADPRLKPYTVDTLIE